MTDVSRRPAVYGRYRYAGSARSSLATTRDNQPIAYDATPNGAALEVRASAMYQGEVVQAVLSIVGSADGTARCTYTASDEREIQSGLGSRVLHYGVGLAMAWDWVRAIWIEAPDALLDCTRILIKNRKHLSRQSVERLEGHRHRRRVLIIP